MCCRPAGMEMSERMPGIRRPANTAQVPWRANHADVFSTSVRDRVSQRPWRSANAFSRASPNQDRKSTRLNSSHVANSYADFWLKKKKQRQNFIKNKYK